LAARIPELAPLREKTVSVFGLGALGAPGVLELARAGVGELRLLDCDIVDAATSVRWPFGFAAAGLPKAQVIQDFIRRNYPFTRVLGIQHRLGGVRSGFENSPSDHEVVERMTAGTSIILDATAEVGVQHFLSDLASDLGVPFVSVDATYGAWGGSICRIRPERTRGCWMCYRAACLDGTIVTPPANPIEEVQPAGCADPTFTGTSFDLGIVALSAIRVVISTTCEGSIAGYPQCNWDVITVSFRDQSGEFVLPRFEGYSLNPHGRCPRCAS
jgi:molybdopterin/thiamine biosynthesis adenylyltransferase